MLNWGKCDRQLFTWEVYAAVMAVSNHQMIQEFLQAWTLSWCKSDGQLSKLEGHAMTIAVLDYSGNATFLTFCDIESGQQYM
jgi:hypothetical protein